MDYLGSKGPCTLPLLSPDIADPRAGNRYGKSSKHLDEIIRDDDSDIPCFVAWRRLHLGLACCHIPRDLAYPHTTFWGWKDIHRLIKRKIIIAYYDRRIISALGTQGKMERETILTLDTCG